MSALNPSVPAIFSTGLICLALGGGAGVVVTQLYGPFFLEQKKSSSSSEGGGREGGVDMMPLPGPPMVAGGEGGGKGKGKGKGGMGKMGAPPGGGRGPSPSLRLAMLVRKLDLLTEKPVALSLSAEQKAKLAESLAGLSTEGPLSDEDADKRLKEMLEVVKGDKALLEAVGFAWPGGPAETPARPQPPNPFMTGENGNPLKALQQRLGKPKS